MGQVMIHHRRCFGLSRKTTHPQTETDQAKLDLDQDKLATEAWSLEGQIITRCTLIW